MPYYAVAKGYRPGIYRYWKECQREVYGFPGSNYRKKICYEDACGFLNRRGVTIRYDCGDYGDHEDDSGYCYYAVAIGRYPGIYHMSWYGCRDEVHGFPGAEYRKYCCRHDARSFMRRRCLLEEYPEYSDVEDSDEYESTDSSYDSNTYEDSSSEYYD